MSLALEHPLRHPDVTSTEVMTKRARWLVVMGWLFPGSAQLVAGNKTLGRFGLTATVVMWLGAIASGVGIVVARAATLSLLTDSVLLLVFQSVMVAYALLWVVLGLDALRLARVSRVRAVQRPLIVLLSLLLTLVPAVGVAWAANLVGVGRSALSSIFADAPAIEPVDGRYNILLLGTDAGADREGLRPDSISLLSVDAKTGQSTIIGIPRELANAPFPETSPMHAIHPNGFGVGPNDFGEWGGCAVGRCILNGLYAEVELFAPELYPNAKLHASSPGVEATKDAVTGITGLQVQFYVLVNMDAFEKMIDALGGITITVQEPLPIGGQIDEYSGQLVNVDGWIQPGEQKMDGYTAIWYARSRYGSATGDYARMERQRELQTAMLHQLSPSNVLMRFEQVASAGTELVNTDIPDSMLGRFVDLAAKASEHTPVNVELVPPQVVPEDPDFGVIQQLVSDGVAAASPQPQQQ